MYFQQKEPIKVQFGEISPGMSEILHFDGLLAKRYKRVISHDVEE